MLSSVLPVLPVISGYTLREYWTELDAELKLEKEREAKRLAAIRELSKKSDEKAAESKVADAKAAEDEKAYQDQISLLEEMYKLGDEIEEIGRNTNLLRLKGDYLGEKRAEIGDRLNKMARKQYPEDEIPEIKGPRSLHAAEKIFLEHSKRFQQVSFNPFLKQIAKTFKGIDIDKRKIEAHDRACALKLRIDEYKRLQRDAEIKSKEEQFKVQLNKKNDPEADLKNDEKLIQQLDLDIKALNENKRELEEKKRTLEYFKNDIIPMLTISPEKRSAKNLRAILANSVWDADTPLEKMMDGYGFSSRTKSILLGHEANNTGYWSYYYYYRPHATLTSCLEEEIKGLSKVEKDIAAIDRQIDKKSKQLMGINRQVSAEKTRSSTVTIMMQTISKLEIQVSEFKQRELNELRDYKDTLQLFIKSVFQSHKEDKVFKESDKYKKLKSVQDELKKEEGCEYKDVRSIKVELAKIRTEVSRHRDTGCFWNIINFFRKTASLNQMNNYFDERNNIKIKLLS